MSDIVNAIVMADFHHGAPDPQRFNYEIENWLLPSLDMTFAHVPIDYVVIAGDFFDRKMDMTHPATNIAFKTLYEIMNRCYHNNCALHILKGTRSHDHDQLDVVENMTCMHRLPNSDFRLVHIYREPVRVEILAEYYALMVPETYPRDYAEYTTSLTRESSDTMHFHGRWDFAAFRDEVLNSERMIRSAPVHQTGDFERLISGPITGGHIHTGDHNRKIWYTRSVTRWRFGEPEPKGYLFTSHKRGTHQFVVYQIDNPIAPQFTTLKCNVNNEEKIYRKARELRTQGHSVKIKVTDASSYHVLQNAAVNDPVGIRIELDTRQRIYETIREEHEENTIIDTFEQRDPVDIIIDYDQKMNNAQDILERDFVNSHIHKQG